MIINEVYYKGGVYLTFMDIFRHRKAFKTEAKLCFPKDSIFIFCLTNVKRATIM